MIGALTAAAVAGGLLIGRWVAARIQRKAFAERAAIEGGEAPAAAADESSRPSLPGASGLDAGAFDDERSETARQGSPIDWRIFPCALGDVVMRTLDHAEAWLAGAIVLREDVPAAALFIAPDAAGERAIYARPRPSSELAWLVPLARESASVGAEPPSALEIDGVRFERRRRLPLRAERWGTGTPEIEGTAIVGEYANPSGEVVLVVVADGVSRTWRGRLLAPFEYEVWSGEKTTA
jgi:hypothetical protein